MIDLHTWPTPNGYKVSIMLEETGLAYKTIPVDISTGAQFEGDFLAISPNNKIPAIVDHEGPGGKPVSLFESGAILIYLAEKTGQFMPSEDPVGRLRVVEWLMFQMGSIGPMLGQAHHFRQYAPEEIAYAVARYTNETSRLYGVMDRRLGEVDYLAGGGYSIADIACFPWIRSYERQGQDLPDFPNLERWFLAISARPAVLKGLKVPDIPKTDPADMDEKTRRILFGDEQYKRR